MHTYISDHMHEAVACSGGNTIDLALLSIRVNGRYIKVSVPLNTVPNKALNTTSNSWKILPREPHTPKSLPPTNDYYCTHPRATGIGCSTLSITIEYKHMYLTYKLPTTTIPSTVQSIPCSIIICLRVHQYNVHPPLSHSSP